MRFHHYGRPTVPGSARGIVPLAIALGTGRAIYGAISANQRKQKRKGYISEAYRSAGRRLATQQGDIQQSTTESLNARGLLQGGAGASAVRAAMTQPTKTGTMTNGPLAGKTFTVNDGDPVATAQGPAATDLASQAQTDLAKEFALERYDLDKAHERAQAENKADAINEQLGSISAGINTGLSVYSMGKDLGALRAGGADAMSATRKAYLTGIDDPANVWGGIHPIDPLGAPGSSWNPTGGTGTVNGVGQPNYDFNTARG